MILGKSQIKGEFKQKNKSEGDISNVVLMLIRERTIFFFKALVIDPLGR